MVAVKTKVSKISATLSVMLDILSVFEHIHHKLNCILGGNHIITMEDLSYMGK